MKKNIISGLIILICSCVFAQASAQSTTDGTVSVAIQEIEGEDAQLVEIALSNLLTANYTAFQMDVRLPEGFELIDESANLSTRLTAHSLSVAKQDAGFYRFSAWSATNVAIVGNSGTLVSFKIAPVSSVDVKKGEELSVVVDNIRFSTRSGKEYRLPDASTNFVVWGEKYTILYMVDGEFYDKASFYVGDVVVPPSVPTREGHTFSGWDGLPEVMPAHDVTVNGSFTVNTYQVIFKIGDEVINTQRVTYGQSISVPEAPVKEGHTFAGWQDVPETMPAADIEIVGRYDVNNYQLVYMVDGVVYKELSVAYGTTIAPLANLEREGHTFSGWDGLPEVMPAHDVTVNGSFTVNTYQVIFKIGDEVIDTQRVTYGQSITVPEAPVKEGHTFAGWQDVPETMPAADIEIVGRYDVNNYQLVYMVDGVVYKELSVAYGTTIAPLANPEREGHTFSGWDGLPEVMPAYDVTVNGEFSINSYTIMYYLDGQHYTTQTWEYNAVIVAPEVVFEDADREFTGWVDLPERMPATDLEIHGVSFVSAISLPTVTIEESQKVYDLHGKFVGVVSDKSLFKRLKTGVYIIGGKKVLVR